MSRHELTAEERGRALDTRRALLAARLEDFDWLAQNGVNLCEAAVRAGWPTVTAAVTALRRAGHPLAYVLERERREAA
jgi:hypothetical protein